MNEIADHDRLGGRAAGRRDARDRQQRAAGRPGHVEIARNIEGVSQAATETGTAASQLLNAAGDLSHQAETLRGDVDGFLANVRAA